MLQPENVPSGGAGTSKPPCYSDLVAYDPIQNRVREVRKSLGLSLRGLESLMVDEHGETIMSHSTIDRIEKGAQPVTLDQLNALATAMECDPACLVTRGHTSESPEFMLPEPELEGAVLWFIARFGYEEHQSIEEYPNFDDWRETALPDIWLFLGQMKNDTTRMRMEGASSAEVFVRLLGAFQNWREQRSSKAQVDQARDRR